MLWFLFFRSYLETATLSFIVLLVVSEALAYVILFLLPDQDIEDLKFVAGNISTGEGHAWRWAPNKTPDS